MKLIFEGGVTADVRLDRVVGRLCVARREFQNKNFRSPAGAKFRIDAAPHSGFVLELECPCPACGLAGRITHVRWRDVVIDGKPPRPPTKRALEAARKLGGEAAAEELLETWKHGGGST